MPSEFIYLCPTETRRHLIATRQNKYKTRVFSTIGNIPLSNNLPFIMPRSSNLHVHFAPGTTGGKKRSKGKVDFMTANLYQGAPDKLTRAEAAEVDAQMSSNPQCMFLHLLCRVTQLVVFNLLDHDRERDFELSAEDVPESE